MAINNQQTSYQFGQMGSVFNDDGTLIQPPTGKVFVAVQFLEDTTLEAADGLVAANDVNTEFAGTTFLRDEADGNTDADGAHDEASPTATLGSGGTIIDAGNTIPAGTIIYGRYTKVHAAAAKMIIAYIGD
tara:strand:+ start:63 stop:455 length:393 start_codon:yes stop_codon:yes gene_type:complete